MAQILSEIEHRGHMRDSLTGTCRRQAVLNPRRGIGHAGISGYSRRLEMDRRVPSGAGAIGHASAVRRPTRSSSRTSAAAAACRSFLSQEHWTLRDLDSRNGTLVDEQRIRGDYHAAAGRHHSHRQFAPGVRARSVAGVSRFALGAAPTQAVDRHDETVDGPLAADDSTACWRLSRADDDHASPRPDPISRRRSGGRRSRAAQGRPRRGQACAGWRSSWPRRPTCMSLADVALDGLFEGTQVDAGAVLLLPRDLRRRAARRQTWKSSPRAAIRRCRITAFRSSWPRPCCAKARRCWPAT